MTWGRKHLKEFIIETTIVICDNGIEFIEEEIMFKIESSETNITLRLAYNLLLLRALFCDFASSKYVIVPLPPCT